MNRIITAIALLEQNLAERIDSGATTPAAAEAMRQRLNMSFTEWTVCQERRALAQAAGKITLDESITLHSLLGNTPEVFNGQSVAKKAAVTKALVELMR